MFDKFFVVFEDGVYFQDSRGTSRRFNGATTVDYAPRDILPAEQRADTKGVAQTATVGEIAIIPKHHKLKRKFSTFVFYKRK